MIYAGTDAGTFHRMYDGKTKYALHLLAELMNEKGGKTK